MTLQIPVKKVELQKMIMPEPGKAQAEQPWGWHLVLNLYDCSPERIRSEKVIKDFIVELCDRIEMRRFGDPVVIDFGDDPIVTGYSMFQLIETSNVAGHFANNSNAAYLDIFSCKEYDPQLAADFCMEVFQAGSANGVFIHRD